MTVVLMMVIATTRHRPATDLFVCLTVNISPQGKGMTKTRYKDTRKTRGARVKTKNKTTTTTRTKTPDSGSGSDSLSEKDKH